MEREIFILKKYQIKMQIKNKYFKRWVFKRCVNHLSIKVRTVILSYMGQQALVKLSLCKEIYKIITKVNQLKACLME